VLFGIGAIALKHCDVQSVVLLVSQELNGEIAQVRPLPPYITQVSVLLGHI